MLYKEDIIKAVQAYIPWDKLEGKNILIAGATGMIGRCLTDILLHKIKLFGLNCNVYAMGRSMEKAKSRFPQSYFQCKNFNFVEWDVTEAYPKDLPTMNYILHLASNTHPRAYAANPIDTVLANVYGTANLLNICKKQREGRFVLLSSVEIYGENRGDTELFDENYLGYLNSNTLRAGYPESKRCCEALCQAYMQEAGVEIVIPRLPRVFGPTMLAEDSKAVSQFISKAVSEEDIILKSDGKQFYSFMYVIDVVIGILTIMLCGKVGEAYNIASVDNDATLREMAEVAAKIGNTKVIYQLPDELEKVGYSTATKARLNGAKILQLGWRPIYNVSDALERTIRIMKDE